MTVELGHFALILGFVLATAQAIVPLIGNRIGDARLTATGIPLSLAQLAFVGFSFAMLVFAYVSSDFSVANVFANSHSDQPLLYKFTGTWGNHEGSMLLWVLILSLFGASVAVFGGHLPSRLKAATLAVQGAIASTFMAFLILTSNPFARMVPAPVEGKDLNPILQDLGLAIHPPLLYLGYVGFSITFAFAIAALIEGRLDDAWARWVRPWALAAWVFLTLGIAMGSYWAYYELGWGGWWFWDPVENASLMPWLSGTALLHSAIVVEKRNALRIWTVLLAIVTFSLSLLGTFLVRSGVLTSVHTFASDPSRGVFILAILVLFIGGSLTLFAIRAPSLKAGGLFAPVSRESALVLNNLFLCSAAATVLLGTLYPLGYEALTGAKISVGPPFFNIAVLPIIVLLALAMPFGPFLPWKRGDLAGVASRLAAACLIALACGFALYLVVDDGASLAPLGIAVGLFLLIGSIWELAWRGKAFQVSARETLRRLSNLPRSNYGAFFGHAGLAVSILGAVAASAWSTETILTMRPGESVQVAGKQIVYRRAIAVDGPNYRETRLTFDVSDGASTRSLAPSKRFYPARRSPTTEAAISTYGFSQLYISLGDVEPDQSAVVRIYWKSWITLIWLGTVIMAFGGCLSLSDRRLRIGVANRLKRPKAVTA